MNSTSSGLKTIEKLVSVHGHQEHVNTAINNSHSAWSIHGLVFRFERAPDNGATVESDFTVYRFIVEFYR